MRGGRLEGGETGRPSLGGETSNGGDSEGRLEGGDLERGRLGRGETRWVETQREVRLKVGGELGRWADLEG